MHLEVSPGPQWFSGPDFLIDFLSIVVLVLIALFAWKFYALDKSKKKHLWFSVSMLVLASSFFLKIVSYTLLYSTEFHVRMFQTLSQTFYYLTFNTSFILVFLVYSVLSLSGLFILFSVYEKTSKYTTFLIFYMLLIIAVFSEDAYLFLHLTAFVLSSFIALRFWLNYEKNKLNSTKLLAISFGVIAISRIFFILAKVINTMYVLGEIIQLIGYLILLFTFITVLNHGKKKGKNRNN